MGELYPTPNKEQTRLDALDAERDLLVPGMTSARASAISSGDFFDPLIEAMQDAVEAEKNTTEASKEPSATNSEENE